MDEARTALIRYVFLDIVDFSIKRTVEAQSEIIGVLNRIVKDAVGGYPVPSDSILYLPTGDGICVCILNQIDPFDVHLQISLSILRLLEDHNRSQPDLRRKFKVRIGVNENQDNIIIDINGHQNVAGLGINTAQRIMTLAEPLQINVGEPVYERLSQREAYNERFRKRSAEVKHGLELVCYQYVNSNLSYLDSHVPGKPQKGLKMPQQVAVYHVLLTIFKPEIEKHYGSVSSGYVLILILCFISMDYMKYVALDSLGRRTWSSMIFDNEINSFSKGFQAIRKSDFWTIVKASYQCKRELSLDAWSHIFKGGLISENRNYVKMVGRQWPGLERRVSQVLTEMYPWHEAQR